MAGSPAYYDFFRKITLQPDGVTLEADSTSDTLTITGGNGVAFNPDANADSFTIDVDYQLYVPVGSTRIRLQDVNSNTRDIILTAGSNISIGRNSDSELIITATVGGSSKSISNASATNPVVVTTTSDHGFSEGLPVTVTDVVGMTELNGNEYYMDVLTGDTFALYTDSNLTVPLDGTLFTPYSTGGVATAEYATPTSLTLLNDVDLTGTPPVSEDVLYFNGTAWVAHSSTNWDTAYSWGDHSAAGYLTSETDPVFSASDVAGVTSTDISNWDTAYGWGDHSTQSYLTSISGLNISDLTNDSGYLTSYTETDPVVGAVTGIVKSDGAGNISAAVEGTDYLSSVAFGDLTSTPTTLSGYGITDAATSAQGALADSAVQQGDVLVGDLVGSVFGDDSTPIVDAINNRLIVAGVEIQADSTYTSGTININGSIFVQGDSSDYYSYFQRGLSVSGNAYFFGRTNFTSNEASTPISATTSGTVTINWNTSDTNQIFPTGAWTLDMTGVPLSNSVTYLITVYIFQGATAYFPSTISVNSNDVTTNIFWQNGSPPTPTSSGVDLLQFQIVVDESSTYRILGQMTTYAQ